MRRQFFAWLLISLVTPCASASDPIAPDPQSGPPTLSAPYPLEGKPSASIGTLVVAGVGKVTLSAKLAKGHLYIQAANAEKIEIGRAESIRGIGDASIYIQSPRGLLKLVIHWKG